MRFRVGVIVMLTLAIVFSGQAEETNSPAVIENLFAAPLPAVANAPPRLLPAIDAREYFIEGNTALSLEKFNLLTNYLGELDITRLREGLDRLQTLYRHAGFSNVTVTLPEQEFTNGIIRVQIVGPETNAATEADLSAAITNLFAAPKPTVPVRGYLIEGNTVLPVEEFSFLTNYIGDLDFARLREGLGKLQLRYRDLGFATVGVTLPEQRLTNGMVRVVVVEGKLSHIIVTDNRYFSTDNVLRALPSLGTNLLLNTRWFQPELDRANLNQDRQIYPVISPGPEPGTSDLTLKVKDRWPLHGHFEINDKSTPGTPLLRLDSALQYDNLWQRNHQVGLDYNFSPQSMKPDGEAPGFYDQPMVASYSGYYRLPLGSGQGLREDYENLPVTFGYDEVTHRFNLPPATGNPDLIFYASRANSDTPVQYGPLQTIFDSPTNPLVKIYQQTAQHTPTINDDAGTRLTVPVREFLGVNSSVQLGFDYKSYQAQTYSTNLTYFDLYALDSFGNPVLETNQTIRLPSNSQNSLFYLPLSLRWAGTRMDKTGSTSLSVSENIFLQALSSARSGFQAVAGSPQAGGNYTTINAGLIRLQNLPGNWSALFNANGQWASEPLIANEQFAIGGTTGVRGYQEGENYGDTGWRMQFDLRAPPVSVGSFPTRDGEVPAYLRCSWFMDYGQVNLFDRPNVVGGSLNEWGTGLGFFLTAGEHFNARLTLAWALADTAEGNALKPNTPAVVQTPQGDMHAYFSVGYQF
ncbi:MAG: POTRA domain-containing protein [Verrucomicrobiota bacterium]